MVWGSHCPHNFIKFFCPQILRFSNEEFWRHFRDSEKGSIMGLMYRKGVWKNTFTFLATGGKGSSSLVGRAVGGRRLAASGSSG